MHFASTQCIFAVSIQEYNVFTVECSPCVFIRPGLLKMSNVKVHFLVSSECRHDRIVVYSLNKFLCNTVVSNLLVGIHQSVKLDSVTKKRNMQSLLIFVFFNQMYPLKTI